MNNITDKDIDIIKEEIININYYVDGYNNDTIGFYEMASKFEDIIILIMNKFNFEDFRNVEIS